MLTPSRNPCRCMLCFAHRRWCRGHAARSVWGERHLFVCSQQALLCGCVSVSVRGSPKALRLRRTGDQALLAGRTRTGGLWQPKPRLQGAGGRDHVRRFFLPRFFLVVDYVLPGTRNPHFARPPTLFLLGEGLEVVLYFAECTMSHLGPKPGCLCAKCCPRTLHNTDMGTCLTRKLFMSPIPPPSPSPPCARAASLHLHCG